MRGSPRDVVRAELRTALHELSDELQDESRERARLIDSVRHASLLADLAEVRDGMVPLLLRDLENDLEGQKPVERGYFADELDSAAARMS